MKKSMRDSLQTVIDLAEAGKTTKLSQKTFDNMIEYLRLGHTGLNVDITRDKIRVQGGKTFEIYKSGTGE